MDNSNVGETKLDMPAGLKISFQTRRHDQYKYKIAQATLDGKLVGFFSFRLIKNGICSRIYSNGTHVFSPYQGRGIAFALWNKAIEKYKPKYISVCIVSDGGKALVKKLSRFHKEIDWDVW